MLLENIVLEINRMGQNKVALATFGMYAVLWPLSAASRIGAPEHEC